MSALSVMSSEVVRISRRSAGRAPLAALAFTLSALGVLAGCSSFPSPEYQGDGELTTMPPNAKAPWRHELELAPINLREPGSSTFNLANLPSDNMVVVLCIDQPGEAAARALEAANTRVRVTLTDLNTGDTSVKEGRLLGDFGETPESWAGEPMEFESLWFRAFRHNRFSLSIDVMVDQAIAGPVLTATPRVRAGPGLGVRNSR
jgi:hypothetical protein